MTAGAIGVAIALGAVGLGSAFVPGDEQAATLVAGDVDRGSLTVPGGDGGAAGAGDRGQGRDGASTTDGTASTPGSSSDPAPDAPTRGTRDRDGDRGPARGGDAAAGADAADGADDDRDGAVPDAPGAADPADPATPDGGGGAGGEDGADDPDATDDRAPVRLRVVASSVSGAEDDGLREGTVVRLRVEARDGERTLASWASTGPVVRFASTHRARGHGADDGAFVVGDPARPTTDVDPDDPRLAPPAAVTVRSAVPSGARNRFDVTVRLGAADAHALNARGTGLTGRVALRSWVDLVPATADRDRAEAGAIGGRGLEVRWRMDVVGVPTDDPTTAPDPTERDADGGVSNVVEVQTPLTTDDGDPVVPDDLGPAPATADGEGDAATGPTPDGRPSGAPAGGDAAGGDPGPEPAPGAPAAAGSDDDGSTTTPDRGTGDDGPAAAPGDVGADDAATPEPSPTDVPPPAELLPDVTVTPDEVSVGVTTGGGIAVVVALPDVGEPTAS